MRKELESGGFLSRVFSPVAADDESLDRALNAKQQRIIKESTSRNELGLYRNASLTLACIEISRGNLESALQYLLDVAFLDMNGATNSLPGHDSFNPQLAELLPFVVSIIRDMARERGIATALLEQPFKSRWTDFSSFGKPPFSADTTWRKLQTAVMP